MVVALLLSASLGNRLAARADQALGAHEPRDCTSFVERVFRKEGVRIAGSVREMHAQARRAGALRRRPRRGDLVFFRNTYDKDRDGVLDDGLTHVGIVDRVRPDGSVTFVHRAGRGVTRSALDPRRRRLYRDRRGEVHNDFLRRQPPALSGELFVDFADPARLAARSR